MKKPIPCTVVCNTKNGYCISPYNAPSINAAIKYAAELGLAYRIFINGKLIKSGWRIKQ